MINIDKNLDGCLEQGYIRSLLKSWPDPGPD